MFGRARGEGFDLFGDYLHPAYLGTAEVYDVGGVCGEWARFEPEDLVDAVMLAERALVGSSFRELGEFVHVVMTPR